MKTKKIHWFRKLMNDLHLWLGIASSLILFVVCLTGTIYTFKTEIEEWIEPHKYQVEVLDSQWMLGDLVEEVETITVGEVSRVSITDDAKRAYEFNVKIGRASCRERV